MSASAEANREDASACIQVARRSLAAKDWAKAERFAAKAQNLYPSDEVRDSRRQGRCTQRGHEREHGLLCVPVCALALCTL